MPAVTALEPETSSSHHQTIRMASTRQRKKSSHRSRHMLIHFHDNGVVCPSSFGQTCPEDGQWDGGKEGDPYEGHVSIDMFANAAGKNGMSNGPHGMAAAMAAAMSGMGGGEGGDQAASMMNLAMATMLSAAVSAEGGGAGGEGSADGGGAGGLNPAMAMMAMMSAMMGAGGGAGGDGTANGDDGGGMMAANPMMAMMGAMAAMSQGPSLQITGPDDADGTNGTAANGKSFQQNPVQMAFQRMVKQQMGNMQIQQKVAQSKTLRNLTDGQVREFSEEKFQTNKEFMNFMGNPNTEIRAKQEQLLKVRNFLPPQSQDPEIFILEKLVNEQVANAGAVSSLSAKDAERLRLQEQLFRMRSVRKDSQARREYLLNQAKTLQARATKYKEKLAVVWEERLKDELEKTAPLEEVCAALREDLDSQHKRRLEAFETKMKPIIIRDGPSRKANYKIAAAKLHYEIYALTQRLRLTTIRVEYEEAKRSKREKQVRKLRDEISEKKTLITTVTKGIPFAKIEVRPQDQLPKHSGPLTGEANPMLSSTAAAALIAHGMSSTTPVPFGGPASTNSMFAPTPVPPGSNQLALPGPGMGTHGGRDPLPGPGLPGGQLSLPAPSLSALNAASAASAGDDPTRPPAYVPDPLPPSIQQSAAAAAAARLAKDEETDAEEREAAADIDRLINAIGNNQAITMQ